MNHNEIERWYRLKRIQKASQYVVIVAVIIAIAGYFLAKYMKPPAEQFAASNIDSGMKIENFAYSAPGVHPWELKASSATVSDNLNKVDLQDPSVIYKGGKGGEIFLTAATGKLDKSTKTVSAQGNVKVAYRDLSFSAGEIDYLDEKRVAESSSAVSLDGGDLQVTGKGLTLSIEKEEIVIEQDVRASISNVHLFANKKSSM